MIKYTHPKYTWSMIIHDQICLNYTYTYTIHYIYLIHDHSWSNVLKWSTILNPWSFIFKYMWSYMIKYTQFMIIHDQIYLIHDQSWSSTINSIYFLTIRSIQSNLSRSNISDLCHIYSLIQHKMASQKSLR